MMPYFSIDTETTGLDASYCQVIEFAAVFEDWKTPVDELPGWSCLIRHNKIIGEPYALAMNSDILYKIADPDKHPDETFLWPGQVMPEFRKWVEAIGKIYDIKLDPMHLNAAGKNFGSFDRDFIKTLDPKMQTVKFRHRSLDPASLFLQPDDESLPGTELCLERAGLPTAVKHRGDADARQVIAMSRERYSRLWNIAL